jgi:hypothetical protein
MPVAVGPGGLREDVSGCFRGDEDVCYPDGPYVLSV